MVIYYFARNSFLRTANRLCFYRKLINLVEGDRLNLFKLQPITQTPSFVLRSDKLLFKVLQHQYISSVQQLVDLSNEIEFNSYPVPVQLLTPGNVSSLK